MDAHEHHHGAHDNGHPHWHSHDHSHGHSHGHSHAHHHHVPARLDRIFAIGAAVNLAFVVGEVGFGIAANSMALIADAAHNFGDVLGLGMAWAATWLGRRPPTSRRTYGWGRGSILAALGNAAVLLVSVGAIGVEAVHRLLDVQPVQTGLVMIVAAAGILVNGGSALLFLRDRSHDLNVRAQFSHLAGDAAIAAGVVLAALAIRLTGLVWLDPLVSLIVGGLIVWGTWGLLRESLGLALDEVPATVQHADVAAYLADIPGVIEVHDLHIWGLSTTETALTVHLVYDTAAEPREPHRLSEDMRHRFGIGHVTVQIESSADAALCGLRPGDVV
jgi:cobalt-zinc-cadmium efflux system protein